MVERLFSGQLTGTVVGNYRLEELIEQHKWGPIFAARSKTGKDYMLRFIGVPSAEMTPDARIVFLGRFQQEANQVAALQHPHVLPLLDYGNYQGTPYLVYPRLTLISLRALLAQSVPTDLLSVARYLDRIASALEYAHDRAVLHRNLSTKSIYLAQQNRQIVIAEFGLLRMVELSRQELSSKDADGPQRPSYDGSNESGAPEQWLGKPIDTYTDIYAMGTVLYRLLTGHQPFSGKTREEIARQHLYARIPAISTWRQGLPTDLDHIITKAMAKEPLQRFRKPSALAQAYRQIVAPNESYQSAVAVPPPPASFSGFSSLQSSAPLPQVEWSKSKPAQLSRRRLITVAGAAGGVAVTAAAVLLGSRVLKGGTPPSAAAQSTMASGQAANPTPATQSMNATTQGHTVLAHTTDLPRNSAKTFPIANQQRPGVLIHLPDDRFVAFDTTCTHAQCQVNYNQQNSLLECPCHGAVFNPAKNAVPVQGPAQTPLTAIKVTVNPDGTITTV